MSDVTNTTLGKVFSVEVLISLVAMLLTFWGGYSVLADDQKESEIAIKELSDRQTMTQTQTGQILTDVAVVKTQLLNINEKVEKAATKAEANTQLLQEILRRLPADRQ